MISLVTFSELRGAIITAALVLCGLAGALWAAFTRGRSSARESDRARELDAVRVREKEIAQEDAKIAAEVNAKIEHDRASIPDVAEPTEADAQALIDLASRDRPK